MPSSSPSHGSPTAPVGALLLVHAAQPAVTAWVTRGLVPSHVTDLGSWTAVTPATESARAAAPYDDARTTLAARPVSTALRPSIGFFVNERRGVVVIQPTGWRAVKRWMVWLPGTGVVKAPRLPSARPVDLATVAGLGGTSLPRLVEAIRAMPSAPLTWLTGVHAALGLPGHGLLTERDAHRGTLVEPDLESVARFDALMAEEAAHLAEVGATRPEEQP